MNVDDKGVVGGFKALILSLPEVQKEKGLVNV